VRFTALMIEAVRTSETSVYSNETTLLYIPEYSKTSLLGLFLSVFIPSCI
jgi:hypothetical protein